MRSTPSAPSPEARGGRWTLWGAGDAKQPLKWRESALKARAAARETVPRRLIPADVIVIDHNHGLRMPGVGEAGQRLANLDTSHDPTHSSSEIPASLEASTLYSCIYTVGERDLSNSSSP